MLDTMTATDWKMWRDYYATLPDRAEYYLSQLCSLVANAHFKRPDRRLFTPSDFRPDFRTPAEREAADRAYARAQAEFKTMVEAARQELAMQNGQI